MSCSLRDLLVATAPLLAQPPPRPSLLRAATLAGLYHYHRPGNGLGRTLDRERITIHFRMEHEAGSLTLSQGCRRTLDEYHAVNRSRRIFEVAQYNWIIVPTLFCFAYAAAYRMFDKANGGHITVDDSLTWTWGSVLWIVAILPGQPMLLASMLGCCIPMRPFRIAQSPVKRSLNRLLICLVTRGDQKEIVKRSVFLVQDIVAKIDPRVSYHVLTDGARAEGFRGMFRDDIIVHGVPNSYQPLKAKYKARCLEWFRINMELQDDDWVLHLDEETVIDEFLIKTCLDFIQRQDICDMGMGVIHYNGHDYWKNAFTTSGDISRVQDDYGRLQVQGNYLHQAALGIHGAFVLMSGKMENAVTWDTDSLTEDYWFCLNGLKKGFRIGWIPAIARELSPATAVDYIRQRRRWFSGILGLRRPMGMFMTVTWAWRILEPVYHMYWFLTRSWDDAVPRWFYCMLIFHFTYDKLYGALMLFVQDWDAGLPWTTMVLTQTCAFIIRPFIVLLDCFAVFTAILQPDKGFYIIKKD